jgi:DNA invertase Pin-like site-specific DNA recombinase
VPCTGCRAVEPATKHIRFEPHCDATANPGATAVVYARVSSKDQEREGFSIPAQLKLLRAYALEHRLTILQEFVDVETAKQAGRGGFGEMLAFLKANPSCRTILVEKTDRLYRNIRDWITVDDRDLAVHFVKENAVVSKASRSSEKFMHGIKVLMAKNYVDNLSEEVKKGLREKAEQGHCGRCGCAMTAERKKAKYTYYRCTGFHGPCGNEYIREERLADLLGGVVQRIQIPGDVADWIADHLRDSQTETEQARQRSVSQLAQRQRAVQAKLDRGYEDYLESRISESFWTRKSQEWETESATIEREIGRLTRPAPAIVATGEKILELAKQAEFLYKTQTPAEQRRLLETVLSNCSFDRGSLAPTYSKPFDLLVRGNETGCWRGRRDSNPRPPA